MWGMRYASSAMKCVIDGFCGPRNATDGGQPLTPHDLIRQADENLYQAKNAGRNRVVA